jgi:hypothetical protein
MANKPLEWPGRALAEARQEDRWQRLNGPVMITWPDGTRILLPQPGRQARPARHRRPPQKR